MKRSLFKVLAFIAALLLGTQLYAAPPANDNLANAQELTGDSGTVTVDTTEATHEDFEDDLIWGNSQHTVWYKWTAPKTGIVSFDTYGSDFDTILVAYSDSTTWDVLAENDDGYEDNTSRIEFPAQAGQVYLIRVGGYSDDFGTLDLRWHFVIRPENDNLANAQELAGDFGTVTTDTTDATREDFEYNDLPDPYCYSRHTVWYKWTASEDGYVYFDSEGAGFDAILGAYTNSITVVDGTTYTNFISVANYDGNRDCMKFWTKAGQTYLISVGGYEDDSGKLDLKYSHATPQDLTGDFGAVIVNNFKTVGAGGRSKHTLLYKWTAQNAEPAYMENFRVNVGCVDMYVYTNATTDVCYSYGNQFCAYAGQTYLIRVDLSGAYEDDEDLALVWSRDLAEGDWRIIAADGIVLKSFGDLPEDLKTSDFPAGVTNIAKYAFEYANIRFVTIPAAVKEISDYAFAYSSLAWVDYEGDTNAVEVSKTAFRGTPYGRELPFDLILKEGTYTNVYWNAEGVYVTNYTQYCAVEGFVGTCPNELVIPEGVTRVLSGAFSGKGCEDITKVTFPSTLQSTEIIDYGAGECRPYYAVEDRAFSGCEALEEVVGIPATAKISIYAFSGSLYEKVRPFELAIEEHYDYWVRDGVRGIFTNATAHTWVFGFHGACPEEVTIPEGIYGIGCNEFSLSSERNYGYGDWFSQENIKKVILPASISNVGEYAFSYLPNLETVEFAGDTEEVFDVHAFYGTPYYQNQPFKLITDWRLFYQHDEDGSLVYDENGYAVVSSNLWVTAYRGKAPEQIVIPEGVYGIESSVFEGLKGVTAVTLPASVKRIYRYAFADCEDLQTVTFSGDLKEINKDKKDDEDDEEYSPVDGLDYVFLNTPYCANLDEFKVLCDYCTYDHFEAVHNEYGDYWYVTSSPSNYYRINGFVGRLPEKLDLSQYLTNNYVGVTFRYKAFADVETLTELVLPDTLYCEFYGYSYWAEDATGTNRLFVVNNHDSDFRAFNNCSKLEKVSLRGDYYATNKVWLTKNFQGTPWLDTEMNFEFVTKVYTITNHVDMGDGCCTPYSVKTNVVDKNVITGFYGNAPAALTNFPENVDEIADYVFSDCDNIVEVVVPGHITSIGEGAFAHCDNLQYVEFEEGVETIGNSLFYGCGDGMQVILPASSVAGHYVVDEDASSDDDALVWRGDRVKLRGGSFSYGFVFNGIDGDVDVLAPRTTGIYDRAFYDDYFFGRTCVEYYTLVHLDANGGTFEGDTDYRCFDDVVTGLPTPVLSGNVFREWWYAGEFYRNGDEWGENAPQVYLKAQWATERKYTVYGLLGPTEITLGDGDDYETLLRVLEDMYGAEPQPSRHGLTFRYWMVDGVELNHRSEIGPNSTFGAFFDEFNPLTDKPDAAVDRTAAQTYDGYILDYKGNNAGTIQVKVGKPNAKTGEANVSAKVQMFGKAKVSFKADPKGKWKLETGGATKGVTLFSAKEPNKIVIDISEKGVFGTFGTYDIIGSRNTSKKNAAYNNWVGRSYEVAFMTKDGTGSAFTGGYSGVTVSIANKGKVKITGVMADGAKVNASAQLLISDKGEGCVNVFAPMYAGKKGGFGFVLWIDKDFTTASVESVSTWTSTDKKAPFTAELEVVGVAAPAPASAMTFTLEAVPTISGATVLTNYLPIAVKANFGGGKITVAKANKIKVDRTGGLTRVGTTDNDAGLKLTYTAKSGAFKGSFTVFTLVNSKLKKVRANVNGVFVKGEGYGTAVIKNVGSFPVILR